MPIGAVIDIEGERKQASRSGILLLSDGSYRRDEGVVIRKGTQATILIGAKAYTGNIAEDIHITERMLEARIFRPGFRKLTQ